MYRGLVSNMNGGYTMQFVTQFVNQFLSLLESATCGIRQRPHLRSIGLVIYKISEFATELFGITVHHVRSWTNGTKLRWWGFGAGWSGVKLRRLMCAEV
jgi:hypothetical protein